MCHKIVSKNNIYSGEGVFSDALQELLTIFLRFLIYNEAGGEWRDGDDDDGSDSEVV